MGVGWGTSLLSGSATEQGSEAENNSRSVSDKEEGCLLAALKGRAFCTPPKLKAQPSLSGRSLEAFCIIRFPTMHLGITWQLWNGLGPIRIGGI